jgi:hypothetical protein
MMSIDEQYGALLVLDFISDLFTTGKKESFTRTDILIFLDHVRNQPDIFEADVVLAHQIATSELAAELDSIA